MILVHFMQTVASVYFQEKLREASRMKLEHSHDHGNGKDHHKHHHHHHHCGPDTNIDALIPNPHSRSFEIVDGDTTNTSALPPATTVFTSTTSPLSPDSHIATTPTNTDVPNGNGNGHDHGHGHEGGAEQDEEACDGHAHGETDEGHAHALAFDARIEKRVGTYILELGIASHRYAQRHGVCVCVCVCEYLHLHLQFFFSKTWQCHVFYSATHSPSPLHLTV